MLGSVFLGFPKMQDDVLTSVSTASVSKNLSLEGPLLPPALHDKVKNTRSLTGVQKPVVLMKLTSQWSLKEGKQTALPW